MKNIFRNIVRTWKVAIYEMKIVLCSTKFFTLSLVSWVFMDLFFMGIRDFALDYHLRVVPASLPFYFSDMVYCNIAFLLLIFLFSDVPYKNNSQKQLLSRCGITCLGTGQMVAIAGIAIIFVIEQFLFSILSCISCLELSGWGKVWGSVAAGKTFELGYGSYVSVSQNILSTYTPWQAILSSMFLFWLTGICYGFLEFLFNGISNGKIGTAILSVWSLIWIFLQQIGDDRLYSFYRFSPQKWNDLSNKDSSGVIVTGCILLFTIVLFFIINLIIIKKRKIEMV